MTGTNEFDLSFLANLSAIGAFIVTLFGAAVGIHGYWKFRSGWKAKTRADRIQSGSEKDPD